MNGMTLYQENGYGYLIKQKPLYLTNKKGLLWFGTGINHTSFTSSGPGMNDGVFFSFKPFDLDINKSVSSKNLNLKSKEKLGGTFTMQPSSTPVYSRDVKISFSIVNHSINESIKNTKKLQLLVRLLESLAPKIYDKNGGAADWKASTKEEKGYFRMLYNNIVSKNFIKNPNNFESFKEQAQLCFLKGFSFEIDKDMGFFEYKGLLLCKKINVSLEVEELIEQGRSLGLKTSPSYRDSNDSRSLKRRTLKNVSIFKNKESYFKDK